MTPLLIIGGVGVASFVLLFMNRTDPTSIKEIKPKPVDQLTKLGEVGGIIGVVAGVIAAVRSTTHLTANEWVQAVQNPFGVALARLANANAEALQQGTATLVSVIGTKNAIQALWDEYRAAADEFAAVDTAHATVINQSYATLTPLMNQLFSDLNGNISNLS
jgi:hypothetical protein